MKIHTWEEFDNINDQLSKIPGTNNALRKWAEDNNEIVEQARHQRTGKALSNFWVNGNFICPTCKTPVEDGRVKISKNSKTKNWKVSQWCCSRNGIEKSDISNDASWIGSVLNIIMEWKKTAWDSSVEYCKREVNSDSRYSYVSDRERFGITLFIGLYNLETKGFITQTLDPSSYNPESMTFFRSEIHHINSSKLVNKVENLSLVNKKLHFAIEHELFSKFANQVHTIDNVELWYMLLYIINKYGLSNYNEPNDFMNKWDSSVLEMLKNNKVKNVRRELIPTFFEKEKDAEVESKEVVSQTG